MRVSAVNFLSDIWLFMEANRDISDDVLTLLKRGARDSYKLFRFTCLGRLFYILDLQAEKYSEFSPIIQKTLTFALVENYDDL